MLEPQRGGETPPFISEVTPRKDIDFKSYAQTLLQKSTEVIFHSTGDLRTHVDERGETGYGSRAKPAPKEVPLASCTGETPSQMMYDRAEALRLKLLARLKNEGYEKFMDEYQITAQDLDRRFLKTLGFKKEDQVYTVDALSGTDAELLTFLFGVQQNIVEKETGSGTPVAASGKHSSTWKSWMDHQLTKGQKIAGLDYIKEAVQIPMRFPSGLVQSEEKVMSTMRDYYNDAVSNHLKPGIHVVAHSKTGERIMGNIATISSEMKNALIVVDAAQMRLSPGEIRDAVKNGCMVIVTGSKFPGGPIFSCKVLMNEVRRQEIISYVSSHGFPEGFKDYFSSYDFTRIFEGKKYNNHPPEIPNIPALLKWAAVIPTIEEYYSLNQETMGQVIQFVTDMTRKRLSVTKIDGYQLEPVAGAREEYSKQIVLDKGSNLIPESNPIVSFRIKKGQEYLNKEQLQTVHWLLNHELALKATPNDVSVKKYHLGQPVQESQEPACLRIAPGMEWYTGVYKSIFKDQNIHTMPVDIIQSNHAIDVITEALKPINDSIGKAKIILENWGELATLLSK